MVGIRLLLSLLFVVLLAGCPQEAQIPGGGDDDDAVSTDDDDVVGDDDDIAPDDDDSASDPCLVDNDGDGVGVCDDCDDNDGAVFPGNPEVCDNGIDDDCDALTICAEAEGEDGDAMTYPLTTDADDVTVFYGYDESSAGATTGAELADSLVAYIYADPTDGSDGYAAVYMEGLTGSALIVEDGPGDIALWDLNSSSGEADIDWAWADCCTDGVVIGPLPTDFCVEIDVYYEEELDDIYTWDGTTHHYLGETDEAVTLCAAP